MSSTPKKKTDYVYLSNMNMTDLKKVAEKEKIVITGLNMKEIKSKIASDPRNFPKRFNISRMLWAAGDDDASVMPSTQGNAVEDDDTVEQLKMIDEARAKNLEIGRNKAETTGSIRIAGTLRKYYENLITLVNAKRITKAQLAEKIQVIDTERRPRMEAERVERAEREDVYRRADNEKKGKAKTPAPTPASTPNPSPPVSPKAQAVPTAKITRAKSPPKSPKNDEKPRDYKQVKFQGLTANENSQAKVDVKTAHVQITKSDIEKELEKQRNRRFSFHAPKIVYNSHWGRDAGKMSSELF
jgi:hypothetical protein